MPSHERERHQAMSRTEAEYPLAFAAPFIIRSTGEDMNRLPLYAATPAHALLEANIQIIRYSSITSSHRNIRSPVSI